ncbi:unnamed protein product, partial [Pelagomonas calceolata]
LVNTNINSAPGRDAQRMLSSPMLSMKPPHLPDVPSALPIRSSMVGTASAPSETSTATDSGFARPLSRHDHTAMPKDETVHDVGVTSTESDPDGWPRRPGIRSTASTLSARSVHAQPSSWMPVREVWSTPRVSTVNSSNGLSRSSIETFRSATSTLADRIALAARRLAARGASASLVRSIDATNRPRILPICCDNRVREVVFSRLAS